MKCEACQEREATIHLTQVVDGAVQKLHLCEACAVKSGFDVNSPLSLTDILLAMGGQAKESEPETVRSCPRCRLRGSDFKKKGRLGCPACYDAFTAELLPLVRGMHRSEQHTGKAPSRAAAPAAAARAAAEIENLRRRLAQAVAAEQYEEAAQLRDRLQQLRGGPGPSP